MTRHRAPTFLARVNTATPTRVWGLSCCTAVLGLAAFIGGANSIGDDFTPRAHTTATPSATDDVGQRGMRGLPTPARIFPTDVTVPHYEAVVRPEVPVIATSTPERACRCSPRVPGPPPTVTGLSEGSLAAATTTTTTTERAAETTAATSAATSPTSPTTVTDEQETVDMEPETDPTQTVPDVIEDVKP